jgi:hypothetical protein
MAQQPQSESPLPTSSYSDPIYDRLESVAQRLTRRLGLFLAALVVVVVVAVVVHARLSDSPEAASANAFLKADELQSEAVQERDPTAKGAKLAAAAKALQALADDEKITPYFRARAFIELTQQDLDRNAPADAKTHATRAAELAVKSGDADLQLKADLSRAAALLQGGENAEAEKVYVQVDRQAGARFPDSQVAAVLGAARAMELQGKLDDAVTKLESIINRAEASAHELIQVAREQYYRLKRQIAEKAAPAAAAPTAPAAAPTTAPAPAAPAATAAPAPAAAAPTAAPAPAATAPTAAPAAPAPAAVPAPAPTTPAPATK